MLDQSGVTEPLRFTSCYTNGETPWAYRWAADDKAPTLYYREEEGGVLVVSEPIDEGVRNWNVVPKQSVLRVDTTGVHIEAMKINFGVAA
ncbi:Gamma-glutamyl-hercynylcysteine sulfoxide hydrolase [compost metagenome]